MKELNREKPSSFLPLLPDGARELLEEPHGVFEDGQPIAPLAALTRPLGMLGRIDVPLGMRHQAEHATRVVAQARHAKLGAVGAMRIANGRVSGFRFQVTCYFRT